ncbi:hypothetical protein G7Y89_g3845 [Cudoniella acicularis]|uniref:Rhodopsin domain-containing protein n=1 Tax=Cudoniella acicularis TaxID=354080 RepID=A0A8H4RQL0_9HELO|nr:hypothetical protein G7Y89_g3845 [Cudoniella acicularis]
MWYIGAIPIVPRNYALVVNMFLWTALALIAIIMRIFTRAVIVKRLGWDDWLMSGAMVFSLAFLGTVILQIKYGLGQPVNLATLQPFLASLFSTVPCYNMAQTLYKLSITVQSYRLFSTPNGQKIMKFMMFWITVCGIMSVSGSIFYCGPVAKAWDDSISGWCVDRTALNYSISGFNIVNDLALLLIPTSFLLKLQVPQKQRIVLISVFACGFLVTIVSVIRLKALYTNLSGPIELQPVTGVDIALWSGLEINVAIICCSVPALKALVSKILKGTLSGYSGSSNYAENTAVRKQGQVLQSKTSLTDEEANKSGMTITVEQSIEMKTYVYNRGDDEGSENSLIIENATFGGNGIRHQTTINGGKGSVLSPV